jgi:hypothetical protein
MLGPGVKFVPKRGKECSFANDLFDGGRQVTALAYLLTFGDVQLPPDWKGALSGISRGVERGIFLI